VVLNEFSHVIHAAEHANEFANFISLAFETDSEEKISRRVETARENSWEHRARLFKSIISIEFNDKYRLSYVA
jgi:hypothetical protein